MPTMPKQADVKPEAQAKPAPPPGTASYRNLSTHAIHPSVGDTIPPLAPGDFVDLAPEDVENNRRFIDEGALIDVAAYQAELEDAEVNPTLEATLEDAKEGK